ncbi:MAG: AraC family transcriptional regulator [Verrucomicrobiae bacterium]|nr:AraC family transcriptional regulator [Verrucomicrobiae bacterium]
MTTFSQQMLLKPTMLFGSFAEQGVVLQRYCHKASRATTVSDHFKNSSLILLLNVSGHALLSQHSQAEPLHTYHLPVRPCTFVAQSKQNALISIQQEAGEQHLFFVLEISHRWLTSLLKKQPHAVKKTIRFFLDCSAGQEKPMMAPLCANLRSLCEELSRVQHQEDRPALWFYAKIIELVSHALLEVSDNSCCHRKERLALERIDAVKKNLARNLENPFSLEVCAREVGCSEAYLSRTFSEYTGMTITRYFRNLRLERAAELLRSGKYNVTEAAMEVGYSSLSHFSKAFAEMFDVCPCAFGLSRK